MVLPTISNTVQNAIVGNNNLRLGGPIGAVTPVLVNAMVCYVYSHPRLERRPEGSPGWLVCDDQVIVGNLRQELIT